MRTQLIRNNKCNDKRAWIQREEQTESLDATRGKDCGFGYNKRK